jgi:hypothetical protein
VGIIKLSRNNKKLKILLAICLIGFLSIFLVALAVLNDFRESIGIMSIAIGCDLINPIPTLDWVYFVFPVAVLIYCSTGPWMTREKAVIVAYILSHVAGAILIVIGIAILGSSGRKTVGRYLKWMVTNPLFILVMVFSILLIIAVLYYDFKLKKKPVPGGQ